jgi:hypothetical protein
MQIFEAARFAPAAQNMQNFETIVVDDKEKIEEVGKIKSSPLLLIVGSISLTSRFL